MRHYHPLNVLAIDAETADSRCLTIDVPDSLKAEFSHLAGQHLPVSVATPSGELRRTYSICSAPGEWPLKLGIRLQPHGAFSGFVAETLKPGDVLQAMPPSGRFHLPREAGEHIALFAAGSGITPLLAMAKTLLESSTSSRVSLFYGNRKQSTVMFVEDLFALKNRFPERLQLHFLFSREAQEFELLAGRLDRAKTLELCDAFFGDALPDAAYLCGPDTMIDDVKAGLTTRGMRDEQIYFERFGVTRRGAGTTPALEPVSSGVTEVVVIMDGHRQSFVMPRSGKSIVDAAAEHGIDLPYSCKGGVCATCRTHLASGDVRMAKNFGLEDWEVEAGFVLACQSVPVSDELTLDYDKA